MEICPSRRLSPSREDAEWCAASWETVNSRYAATAMTGTQTSAGNVPDTPRATKPANSAMPATISVTVGQATAGAGSAGSGMRVTVTGDAA